MAAENKVNVTGELSEYLHTLLKSETIDFLNASPEQQSIRVNTLKTDKKTIANKLVSAGVILKEMDFSEQGFIIEEKPFSLSQTIDFFKGKYYFQGASSQIPPLVLKPQPGEKVLDMAASPGSKTTQMAAMMQNKGRLIVNDGNVSRMQALNLNTQKAGMFNHCIYYLPGERIGRLFPEYFDKVLLDTPCSGLGTLASHREIADWWSSEKLRKLNSIQHKLFVSAVKSVKAGGEIVYSTCSVAPEENELLIDDMLRKYPLEILPTENKGMENFDDGFTVYKDRQLHRSLKHSKRIWPHRHGMEGFFIVRLRKTAEYYNKKFPTPVEYLYTSDYSDTEIRIILEDISRVWGIDFELWKNYRFYKTRERIWMFNSDVPEIIKEGFTNGGMLLADQRQYHWKLSHQSVQHFEKAISGRRLSLDKAQTKELFASGICPVESDQHGYFALDLDGLPGAIVYLEKGCLKIKLPHPFFLPE